MIMSDVSSIFNIAEKGVNIWGKNVKVVGHHWNGYSKCYNWFVFSEGGECCWTVIYEPDSDIKIKVKETDIMGWANIYHQGSDGFCDEDFYGCNFKGFDITGTRFTRCIFDVHMREMFGYRKAYFTECVFVKNKEEYKELISKKNKV